MSDAGHLITHVSDTARWTALYRATESARADALFASDLSAWREHTQAVVTAAIRHAIHAHGGSRSCAGEVAAAYGEYGELAARRMRDHILVLAERYREAGAA